MELENVKLTAKLFLKISKTGKQYHQVEIYCKDTLVSQSFLRDTEVKLIELLSKTSVEETSSLKEDTPYME